jgi:TolB-like protein
MNDVIAELKRRKVFRVAAVYGATAFVVLQAADLLASGLALPAWVFSAITLLVIAGFPLAVLLAWAFDMTPSGIRRTGPADARDADTVSRWLPLPTLLLVTALLLLGGAAGWLLRPAVPADDGAAGTSLAVLPFTNLGAADDEYFADGMSDALRGKLAGVDGIMVIASASTRAYRESTKPPQQIGRELGVRYLLTGTVQWARSADGSSRVQVRPELVLAETGTTRWQQPFDAVLAEVFTVQGEIAARVADALSVTLLESQRRRLGAQPTTNLDAYDAFLRASAVLEQAELGAPLRRLAADGFRRAVELDPRFALAWAQLGYAHIGAYWFGEAHGDARERLALARAAIDTALALEPDRVEALIADSYYWYWGWRAYERALAPLERARALDPGDARIEAALGNVLRRQGRLEESLRHKRRALELDPRNAMLYREVANTAAVTGELFLADSASRRAIALAPDAIGGYVFRAKVLYARGDTAAAAAVIRDARSILGEERMITELVNRQWTRWLTLTDLETLRVLDQLPLTSVVVDTGSFQLFRAEWLRLAGQPARAAALADSAVPFLRRSALQAGDDWWYFGQLALAHALAGRPAEVPVELDRAWATLRRSPDAWDRPDLAYHQTRIDLILGDTASALAGLEALLRARDGITPAQVQADLRFAPLRGIARFQQLVTHQ